MKQKALYSTVFCVAGILLAHTCSAQTTSKFGFNIGGGFTEPVRYSKGFDTGFNVTAGVGFKLTPEFGLNAEFGYNQLGLGAAALGAAGAPAGETRIYSVTLNPIIHLNPHGRFDAYITGGGGYYRRTVEFTQPTVGVVTAFDPFFGVFFPAAVPADFVLGSFTQNKGGLNVGAGVSLRIRGDSNAKIYAESRYHYIFTTPGRTTVLPVTFGFRW